MRVLVQIMVPELLKSPGVLCHDAPRGRDQEIIDERAGGFLGPASQA
jgi:hypothetical protein